MKQFNFCKYLRLCTSFEDEEQKYSSSTTMLSRSDLAKKIFKEKFNLTVEINPHDTYGTVWVNEKDFTFILLKWGE